MIKCPNSQCLKKCWLTGSHVCNEDPPCQSQKPSPNSLCTQSCPNRIISCTLQAEWDKWTPNPRSKRRPKGEAMPTFQLRGMGTLKRWTLGRKSTHYRSCWKASGSHCHKHSTNTLTLFPDSTLVTSEGLCALTSQLHRKMGIHPPKGEHLNIWQPSLASHTTDLCRILLYNQAHFKMCCLCTWKNIKLS